MKRNRNWKDRFSLKRMTLILLSLIPSAAIVLFRPLSMNVSQSVVSGILLLTIIWWVTKLVDRTAASVTLLVVFCLFGSTPVSGVFTFPLSETFVLIVLSFLFSEGVKNSGLLDKLLLPVLTRWATSAGRTLISMLIVNLVMIFIIPQPFSRIILVAMVYSRFFHRIGADEDMRRSMLFCLHMSSILVNMVFLRGDLILNSALLTISGVEFSEVDWIRYMAAPSLVWAVISAGVFKLIFRKAFAHFPSFTPESASPWTKKQKRDLITLAIILLLWATESFHGISGMIIVCVGTAAMIPMGLLRLKDLRCLDLKLLIFLTAAFSIGSVMKTSGTAQVIFSRFTTLFPEKFSVGYLLLILLVCTVMHMILGSSITTMSVIIPSLLIICEETVPTEILLFSIYIIASAHCVLPFHNVVTMIGEGKGYFRSKEMFRYGLIMTIPTFLMVILAFYGWWSLIGAG